MELFPLVLLRMAGLKIQTLEMPSETLTDWVHDHFQLREKADEQRQQLLHSIGEDIDQTDDYDAKNRLQNIVRDIKADRKLNSKKQTEPAFGKASKQALQNYLHSKNTLDQSRQNGLEFFETVSKEVQQYLKGLASNPVLHQGLLFSSLSARERIQSFVQKPIEAFRKKEHQTQRRLLTYLGRIAAKTSPFASFTPIGLIDLQGKGIPSWMGKRVQVNNELFHQIREFLSGFEYFSKHLPIRLNPSLHRDGDEWIFVQNINNRERIQRINNHPVLDLIMTWSEGRTVLTNTRVLVSAISKLSGHSKAEVRELVQQLEHYGWLEYKWPVSGTDPQWLTKLRGFLLSLPEQELYNDLNELLESLERWQTEIVRTDIEQRKEILLAAHQLIKSFVHKYQTDDTTAPPEVIPAERIFLEDRAVKTDLDIDQDKLSDIAREITQWLQLGKSYPESTLLKMARECWNQRLDGIAKISLCEFYEQFYHWRSDQTTAFETTVDEDAFNPSLSEGEDGTLHLSASEAPAQQIAHNVAIGAIIQPLCEQGALSRCYLDATFAGYGQMYARYLMLFTELESNQHRRWNQQFSGSDLWVEISDASYFNANCHLPILWHELEVPGGHNFQSEAHLIPVSELFLERTGDDLKLIHQPSGRRVYMLDLGLEVVTARSPFYQLMTIFAPPVFADGWMRSILAERSQRLLSESVVEWPRIHFGEQLILQRRSLFFKKGAFPIREKGEEAFEYFLKVQRWKQTYDLPDRVFVTVHDRSLPDEQRKRRDDYKPQFLDLSQPAFVDLLARMSRRVEEYLKVEEMLPETDQLMTVDGEKRALELVMQWRPGSPEATTS